MGFLESVKKKYEKFTTKKEIKKHSPLVESIFQLALNIRDLSDQQLKTKTEEFKLRIKEGKSLDEILPEAFAVVREANKRILGKRPYVEQVLAGLAIHQGKIVEMKSGEGKTIAETMPAYLNALNGEGVHIVTTNDYLAKRDAEWVGPIFEFLGMSVGKVTELMKDNERRENYAKDITYVANKEVGFDYLRDNLVFDFNERVLRELNFAIIDEVDSILIDEARTPLIISQLVEYPAELFLKITPLISQLNEETDYEIDERFQTVTLTELGLAKLEEILRLEGLDSEKDNQLVYYIYQALKAKALFKKDKNYIVKDGQVILVDEFTGRLTPDRRLMEGLHQAIEAKESVKIREKDQLLAIITFQNFFKLYKKFSGMTGTAETAKDEFQDVYNKEVFVVPTHKPIRRRDLPDVFYLTENSKLSYLIEEIEIRHKRGQPVLIGTPSVEKSILISNLLNEKGIPHQCLNARYHEREARQIAQAGQEGIVTVATNMAGRGTDIILSPGVGVVGGLHVIGTEHHRAKRIDDQLRGRAGRQGEAGSFQFHVSMEDELIQVFGSEEFWQVVENLDLPEDRPMDDVFFQKGFEEAQKLAEALDFDSRKWLYQFDQVFDRQRSIIYKMRDEFLAEENLNKRRAVLEIIDGLWQTYLDDFEQLQQEINLVSYAGRDLLVEYTLRAKKLFDALLLEINLQVASL